MGWAGPAPFQTLGVLKRDAQHLQAAANAKQLAAAGAVANQFLRQATGPEGLEGGRPGPAQGLGLLPLETVFADTKALAQRRSLALWPDGEPALRIEGFELHRGHSKRQEPGDGNACQPIAAAADLGWWQPFGDQGGLVAGTYLHGVFERGAWRRRWLNGLRQRKGLAPLPETVPHHSQQREALLDRLADAFEAHVNLEPLLR